MWDACHNSQLQCVCWRWFQTVYIAASSLRHLHWCTNSASIDSFDHHSGQAIVSPCNWNNCFDLSWQRFALQSTSAIKPNNESDKYNWPALSGSDCVQWQRSLQIRATQLKKKKILVCVCISSCIDSKRLDTATPTRTTIKIHYRGSFDRATDCVWHWACSYRL